MGGRTDVARDAGGEATPPQPGRLEKCDIGATNSGETARQLEGRLEGRLDMRFTLMPDGRAAHANAIRKKTGSTAPLDCSLHLIRSLEFHPDLPILSSWSGGLVPAGVRLHRPVSVRLSKRQRRE